MRNTIRIEISACALLATMVLACVPALAQNQAYRAPRSFDGHPDLNGIWEAVNTANWDLQDHSQGAGTMWEIGAIGAIPPGQGVVEGNQIPYTPAALAKRQA